jgi:hypothetical protein
MENKKETLMRNGLDWYLVEYENGETGLLHETSLSSILQCGENPLNFGIVSMEQCWNGEDLTTE